MIAADSETRRQITSKDSHVERADELIALARELATCNSFTKVLDAICKKSKRLASGARVTVWLANEGNTALDVVASSDASTAQVVDIRAVPIGEGDIGRAYELGETTKRSATPQFQKHVSSSR